MAIDGIFLSLVRRELLPLCGIARVDKVSQPARDTIILGLRGSGSNVKLLLSSSSQTPRLHLTEAVYENPQTPPMFCMLLRKHLTSARLTAITQVELDRILMLYFENRNDMGDMVTLRLAVEIMGRHSNIILLNSEDKILDSIKRVDPSQSSVRQVLPGMKYTLPPWQDKLNIHTAGAAAVYERMLCHESLTTSKSAMASIMGISPIIAAELVGYVTRGEARAMSALSADEKDRLRFFLASLEEKIKKGGTPTMLCTKEGEPKDVSFIPLEAYEGLSLTKSYESYSALLDAFYVKRDLSQRIHQRSGDLFRFLVNHSERLERKMALQQEELAESRDREKLRVLADIINANLYKLKKGDSAAKLENFYEPNSPEIEIPLDVRLTPSQNAQHYYAEYRRADTAERMLIAQLQKAETERQYLDTVLDSLVRATCEAELDSIREELREGGYIKKSGKKRAKPQKLPPIKYISSDGFVIFQGRGNLQNDKLTMKDSARDDIWFHAQNIPGSHVVVQSRGEAVPERTLTEAAMIAALGSKAGTSALIPVDYTTVRHVRKPSGAKPGFVLYVSYKTAVVTPDAGLIESLRVK